MGPGPRALGLRGGVQARAPGPGPGAHIILLDYMIIVLYYTHK